MNDSYPAGTYLLSTTFRTPVLGERLQRSDRRLPEFRFPRDGEELAVPATVFARVIKDAYATLYGYGYRRKSLFTGSLDLLVEPRLIRLGRTEPQGLVTVGTSQFEFVSNAEVTFVIQVRNPVLATALTVDEHWSAIMVHAQETGIGVLRRYGYGRLNLQQFVDLSQHPGTLEKYLAKQSETPSAVMVS